MSSSRRRFLSSLSRGLAACLAEPLLDVRLTTAEPVRASQGEDFIRLNSNENAYGPLPKLADAIKSSLQVVNRYPRMEYPALIERIGNFHGVKPEQVLLGCGSTEMLRAVAFAFGGIGKQFIQASPTFEAIGHYARAAGSQVKPVPLTPRFAHDLDAMLALTRKSSSLVYICNPNNPTASLTPRGDLETFIRKLPTSAYVVIDEAYHHFAGQSGMYASFLDRPLGDERVVVTRTFSKVYGLAGLRLGYAVASPKVIQQMRTFVTDDNINAVVTRAALAALDDRQGVNDSVQRNMNDRQEFFNEAMIRSVKPIDSHANFVMMNTFHPAEDVAKHFRNKGILIARAFPPMDTYVRVSLGLPNEMSAFWKAWDELPFAKNFMSH